MVKNNAARSSQFTNPITGDQVWNKTLKCIEVYDGTDWVSITTKVLNGLNTSENIIKLGGNLIEPTAITTDSINTLAIKGLQKSENNEDLIVVVDKNTGVLKQKKGVLTSQKKQIIITATEGQIEFSIPINFSNTDNIDVYRNGVLINFIALNNTTIKLEPEAICYKNDKIRIVQLF